MTCVIPEFLPFVDYNMIILWQNCRDKFDSGRIKIIYSIYITINIFIFLEMFNKWREAPKNHVDIEW